MLQSTNFTKGYRLMLLDLLILILQGIYRVHIYLNGGHQYIDIGGSNPPERQKTHFCVLWTQFLRPCKWTHFCVLAKWTHLCVLVQNLEHVKV